MKVSLIQISSNNNFKQNYEKAFNYLKTAMQEKPDIICLSELFLYWGKNFNENVLTKSDLLPFQNFAKQNNVNLILGSVAYKQNVANLKPTNTCFCINRVGKIVLQYSKQHFFKYSSPKFSYNESDDFTNDSHTNGIVTLDGIKIGVAICFELRFPQVFKKLAQNGAEVIFLPAHFNKLTGEHAWNALTIARAVENQVYFCACNQVGKYVYGSSQIISYTGQVLSSLNMNEEGILTYNLNLEDRREYIKNFPLLS